MLSVIVKVSSFALIILLGIAAARSGKFGGGADRLISRIVFNLTLPAAIIRAFSTAEFDPSLLGLILVGLGANAAAFFLSLAVYRNEPRRARIVQQANVCGINIGCFGLAFVQAFFPPAAAVATCLFDAGNSLMCAGGTWALLRAFVLDSDYASFKDRARVFARSLFSSVPFDCYVTLVVMSVLGIHLPDQLITLIEPIANANSFLAMFMVGLMARFSVAGEKSRELTRLLSWRLAFSAALSLVAFFLLPLSLPVRQVIAVLAWAPAAATGPLYTMWAGGDEGLAGMSNAITVLVGVIVMTVLVLLLGV